MAWQYHCLVPTDPWQEIAPDKAERAVEYLKTHVHFDVDQSTHEQISFVGSPGITQFAVKCPACGATRDDYEWFIDALSTDWDRVNGDIDAIIAEAPCCSARVAVSQLTFPCPWADKRPEQPAWRNYEVAGFARSVIKLMNCDTPIALEHARAVEAIVGHPLKLIYYVL